MVNDAFYSLWRRCKKDLPHLLASATFQKPANDASLAENEFARAWGVFAVLVRALDLTETGLTAAVNGHEMHVAMNAVGQTLWDLRCRGVVCLFVVMEGEKEKVRGVHASSDAWPDLNALPFALVALITANGVTVYRRAWIHDVPSPSNGTKKPLPFSTLATKGKE